jgi:hypothetical protein
MDKPLGAHYYKLAADHGHANGQCNYGVCLENGDGVAVDKPLAVQYYKLAADQGNASAQNNYGACLSKGAGVAMDKPLAAHHYKLAADQGNAVAQTNYAWCLERGDGTAADTALAAEYYRRAADGGNGDAQFHYGRLLDSGDGVGMDKSLARQYFELAAGRCHAGADADALTAPETRALKHARQLRAAVSQDFTVAINGTQIGRSATEAAALSPAVALQLSVDACAHKMNVHDGRIGSLAISSFWRLLNAGGVSLSPSKSRSLGLLFGRLSNPDLECRFTGLAPTDSLSLLSVDALDALLSDGGMALPISLDSEDALLEAILGLGEDYFPLLKHVRWQFLSSDCLAAAFAEHSAIAPPESVWHGLRERLKRVFLPPPAGFESAIVSTFPDIFCEFSAQQFRLLWRGSRDGFSAREFHRRCDRRGNTLTIVADTAGNIFGGFTAAAWDSGDWKSRDTMFRADRSGKNFLFTIANPHDFPARKFSLKADQTNCAIGCDSSCGPNFCDIGVSGDCNANARSFAGSFGRSYANWTGVSGKTFFAGSSHFIVRDIEVFAIVAGGDESVLSDRSEYDD